MTLTGVVLTIAIQTTGGVTFNGQYNTVGSFVQSHSSTSSAIVYQYMVGVGQSLPAGASWIFAAQASGSGSVHPTSGDSYTLSYTADGISYTATGHF